MAVGYRKGSGEADLIYFEVISVGIRDYVLWRLVTGRAVARLT